MNAVTNAPAEIAALMDSIGRAAVDAARVLGQATTDAKNAALNAAASQIRAQRTAILAANQIDVRHAQERGLSGAMLDRLALDEKRVEAMAKGIEDIVALSDPIGTVSAEWTRPNGMLIQRASAARRRRHHYSGRM
jgi:glutamate-5-semialdehyde dehydrogenase